MKKGFSVRTSADGEHEIEKAIRDFQNETKCNAVSAVTYDHGELRYYGEQEGLFQIGSMTKAFTGLAIQKLIHEGRLKGEDGISDFLPWFVARYKGKEVENTIEQLMKQTSGFTNGEAKYPSASKGQTLKEWTKTFSGKELESMPGERYAYSNANFNLLGQSRPDIFIRTY